MSTQVQYRRGTSAQNDAFTGALAEITVDTTNKTLRVHDGLTAGGFALAGTTATQTLTNKTLNSVTITGTVTGNIIPSANITYDLGNTTNRFNDLWLANSTIYLGSAQISANATSLVLTNPGGGTTVLAGASAQITATSISASGNVTGGNILTGGIISATGNITSAGTIKGVNIDSTAADLAEHYQGDRLYVPGTVMIFGGQHEITESTQYADPRVAGVISTAPAHTMNSAAAGQPVALQGRVPCRVVGTIKKGDLVTTSHWPGVATCLDSGDWVPGCVIGKSLGEYDSLEPGTIEIAVGRL